MDSHHQPPTASRLRQPDVLAILDRRQVMMAYLFGSRARAQPAPTSDVDLAVQLPASSSPMERLEAASSISAELRATLHTPVDVVVLNDASPLLKFEAVIRGVTLVAPDLDEVFRFEKRVRQQFEDFRRIQRFFVDEYRQRLGLTP